VHYLSGGWPICDVVDAGGEERAIAKIVDVKNISAKPEKEND